LPAAEKRCDQYKNAPRDPKRVARDENALRTTQNVCDGLVAVAIGSKILRADPNGVAGD
jgi:hypothetical protein